MSASLNLSQGFLRINRMTPKAGMQYFQPTGSTVAPTSRFPSSQAPGSTATSITEPLKPTSVTGNFTATLSTRLEAAQVKANPANQKSVEETQALLTSLSSAIGAIKDKFGNEKANQVMADILTNTQEALTAESIAGAISGALGGLAQAGASNLNKPGVSAESLVEGQKTAEKMGNLREFLNKEPESAAGDNPKGLNHFLNSYFGVQSLVPKEAKVFQADFSWQKNSPEESEAQLAPLTLGVDEIGREHMAELAMFLRNDLSSETAASYLENLGGDDDIFTAILKARSLLLEDSDEGHTAAGGLGVAGVCTIEGAKFDKFLNSTFLEATNKALQDDPEASGRFNNFMESTQLQAQQCSIFKEAIYVPGIKPLITGELVNRVA